MILIISSDTDLTTNDVLDWLKYYNIPFKRISIKHELLITSISLNENAVNLIFEIDGESYDFNRISSIWYRRSEINIKTPKYESGIDLNFDNSVNRQLREEKMLIHELVWDLFKTKSINSEYNNKINKLKVLKTCTKIKIKYPRSIITSSKAELVKFKNVTGRIITKNISQGIKLEFDDTTFMPFTTEVKLKDIKNLPDIFANMFFQEMIDKSFELRIFYLKGKFYSSAIFSQNDNKTKVDFRNYNHKKPNRTPPFQLDTSYQLLLNKLMIELGLNSGSIDLIVDTKGDYYFLEVNPIGQFQQVSSPCNYFLERKVAKQLMQ
jgi:ATP-GRASP peptide maturase of grasp-with-spasm system